AIASVLPHALELLAGETGSHPTGHHLEGNEPRPSGGGAEPRRTVTATAVKVHVSPPCRVGQRLVIGPNGPLEGTVGCAGFDAADIVEQLAALLRSPARFIGVMGSRRHVGPHVEELRSMGFTDEDLARLRSPVGLDLGARTPQEIAVSIVAGLLAARAGRDGGWLDRS